MASVWEYRVTVVDKDEEVSTLRFDLGTLSGADFGAEALLAQTAADAIHDEFVDVTDAFV